MFVYADNAATTRVLPKVLEAMLPYFTEQYGNPSSTYPLGQEASRALIASRETIARLLGCRPREITFTSGGSESDNQALRTAAAWGKAHGRTRLIASAIEHHAILHTLEALQAEGYSVTLLPANREGQVEPAALEQALTKIKNDEVKVVIVHSGVGAINESDVMLASAANALIIGFNVRPDANARKTAEAEKVDIRTYRVIYDALNDAEAAIKGMLAPKFKEKIIGHVEIRKVIPINKILIAGAYVKDGKITRSAKVRLVRDGIVIHEGELDSLRRFKDDVKEVAANFECGLTLADYRDIKEGDQLEVYVMEEVAAE